MTTFAADLRSPHASESLDGIAAAVATDASGQFALRARHERFLTVLEPGLLRLRHADGHWSYVAQPGAVLHFADNRLTLTARDLLRSDDYAAVVRALDERFAAEDVALQQLHEQVTQMEQEMLRRLWRLQREGRR